MSTDLSHFLKRTWAEINLDALEHNYRFIANLLSPGCRVMAVVKADAYGHGAVQSAQVLRQAGASWFAVSNLEEALQLRRGGITEELLILGYTPPAQAVCLADEKLTQTVFSRAYGAQLSAEAVAAGCQVPVHLKLDTGMSRLGIDCRHEESLSAALDDAAAICRLPGLDAQGVFTHFSSADMPGSEDEAETQAQFACFMRAIDALAARGIRFALRHCCNSAATLRYPEMHLDLVRPGIVLYGLLPDASMAAYEGLRPVMQWKTVVSMVKEVPAGATVSYGRTYAAEQPLRLATLPVGYADGYPRALSNRAHVLIHGQPAPIVGRVCMDQCMADVSAVEGVQAGMTVTLFGADHGAFQPVETLSALAGTIAYETVCLVGKRVPRLFRRGGKVVGQLNYLLPDA